MTIDEHISKAAGDAYINGTDTFTDGAHFGVRLGVELEEVKRIRGYMHEVIPALKSHACHVSLVADLECATIAFDELLAGLKREGEK